MQTIGNFSYNYILTGYGYGKEHLEKSRRTASRVEWLFHSVIGNLERTFILGSLVGLTEGACLGAYSLASRVNALIRRALLSFLDYRGLRNPHTTLVQLVTRLYSGANKEGICHGIALMGMQAIFLGKVDEFNERLEKLEIISVFASLGIKTFEGVIKDLEKDSKEKGDFDLLAFLEGCYLCMNGEENSFDLLDPAIDAKFQASKDFVETFVGMVASKELEKKGTVIEINDPRMGVYTASELASYFTALKEQLSAPPAFQSPISILLEIGVHAVTVGYDPVEKNWIFIDINNRRAERVAGDVEVANKVMKGFAPWIKPDEKIAISHRIYAMNSCGSKEKSQEIQLLETKESNVAPVFHGICSFPYENIKLLSLAAKYGNFNLVRELLQAKVPLNHSLQRVNPLLAEAIGGRACQDMILTLLKSGASPNESFGRADPLMLAIKKRDKSAVRFLLEFSADPNCPGSSNSALGLAISSGQQEIVVDLLKAGADPDKKFGGVPPLIVAIIKRDKVAIRLLLEANADLYAESAGGNSSFKFLEASPYKEEILEAGPEIMRMVQERAARR